MIMITLPDPQFVIDVTGWAGKVRIPLDYISVHQDSVYVAEDYYTERRSYENLMYSQITKGVGGVYFIYAGDSLLYIGRSSNLWQRLRTHTRGGDFVTSEYLRTITEIKGFFTDDISEQEIYETYAIQTLNPLLNTAKTPKFRRK